MKSPSPIDESRYWFGSVAVEGLRAAFYEELNSRVIDLVRSLPRTIQAEAMMFCMAYSGLALGSTLNFFKNYYAPTWSIIPWVLNFQGNNVQTGETMRHLQTVHAMAMLLHSLDDHLNDGEITGTHLTLLLRSQAWHLMMESLQALTHGTGDSRQFLDEIINRYYEGITAKQECGTLNEYCELFRKQMSTGLIAPAAAVSLNAAGGENFLNDLMRAQESFAIAWRILDDIQDAEEDFRRGVKTSVYFILPDRGKMLWSGKGRKSWRQMAGIIRESLAFDTLSQRIVAELNNAADIVSLLGLQGLAAEYRCLAAPMACADKEK